MLPVLLILALLSATATAATYNSDGSQSDVQSKINSAVDGDTITLPSGTFTWTSGVTVAKALKIYGQGSGRIIGRSTSSVSVGTGTKTFTTQSGLSISAGQTLSIFRVGGVMSGGVPTGAQAIMTGTVNSYSGTSLEMNITSTTGSGTHPLWVISTANTTTITNNSSSTLFSLTEDIGGSIEIYSIRIADGSSSSPSIAWTKTTGGYPILIHDMWITTTSSGNGIRPGGNRGVIWNLSMNSLTFSSAYLGFQMKYESSETGSWTSASTWGSSDTGGTNNLYIEDSDFHAYLNCTDNDDNSRTVWRHCLFNNAGLGTHGADTSNYGNRHFEVYDSDLIFNGYNDGNTFNMDQWFYVRGGSFLVTDCTINDISSTDYGNKPEYDLIVMKLQRNGGPNPCWGANNPGNQYPAPRQVGMGRVTGSAGNDSITYVGDSEPAYIWNNTGTFVVGISDYGGGACTNPDSSSNYIVQDRDYYLSAKPSYTKYTYPHPLRTGEVGGGGGSSSGAGKSKPGQGKGRRR